MPNPPQAPLISPFEGIRAYLATLKELAVTGRAEDHWQSRCAAALNGEANEEIRKAAQLEVRRKFGVFFTGSVLSDQLLSQVATVGPSHFFYDPTCGMGDLLLSAAKRLPLGKSVHDTLRLWSKHLGGTDLHQEFVDGAKTRLVLLARMRHSSGSAKHVGASNYFPDIRVGDGLTEASLYRRATHLLLNPPYGKVPIAAGCDWAGGLITEAATFVFTALERSKKGTQIHAILPDVLRSGSFCSQWRNAVSALADIKLVFPYGVFDDAADVDVFRLHLAKRRSSSIRGRQGWPLACRQPVTTLADEFTVHVGRVVPHRDKEAGPLYPYIHPRCVPPWTVMRDFTETRQHTGKVYKAPFVVIRRTSRPGHPYRATATVIGGTSRIAVENHLIVCEPKNKRFSLCKKLMQQLRTTTVNEYLDKRIRCRHLTVGAVSEIPFAINL